MTVEEINDIINSKIEKIPTVSGQSKERFPSISEVNTITPLNLKIVITPILINESPNIYYTSDIPQMIEDITIFNNTDNIIYGHVDTGETFNFFIKCEDSDNYQMYVSDYSKQYITQLTDFDMNSQGAY